MPVSLRALTHSVLLRPALAAALLLAAALPAAPPADAQPRRTTPGRPAPVARVAPVTLRSGPMNGYSLHREVAVWAQTTGPARVQIRYWDETAPAARTTTPAVAATDADGFAVHIVVGDLEPGRRYAYEVLVDGRVAARPYALRFETQALWQWRTDPPAFTFALGSCTYVNETAYDRPGTPYGGAYRVFAPLARLQPAFMLWMGDNTYFREVDWWSERGMDHRHAHTRALAEMQPLLGSAHHYATWDDHDYGPNDADRSWVLKATALRLFKRYWANVSYGIPETDGVFGHFEWNDAAFFLLDDRYHRSPNGTPDGPDKTMFGREQIDWLVDALTTSRAPFKFVVAGGQVLNPVAVYETMATFPDERRRLLDEITRRRISGVVFLTGDRHLTELQRLDRADGAPPLYDFTASSLTAGSARLAPSERDSPTRVAGTLVEGQNNFGTVTLDGPRAARVATLRTYDADGALLWEHRIAAADLAWPASPRTP